MNKDFKFICNVQEQIFGAVMRVHDSIPEQMIVTRFEGQGRKDEEVRGDEPEKGCLITQNKQQ